MKSLISTILFLILSTSLYSETVISDHVRIREYPFLNMPVVGKKYDGDEIQVLSRSDFKETIYGANHYWYFLKFDNQYGWMYGEFINGLKKPNEYRVYTFTTSRDKNIYDYKFENEEFINLLDNKPVNRSTIRTEYAFGDNIACWFDSIEIRNYEGYNGSSNLIIKHRDGKKIILLGDDIGYFYDESSFIKLSPNEKYLMVDQGTSHVRHIGIINTETGERILSGLYTNDLKYDGSNIVSYFKSAKRITNDKDAVISFIIENSVRDIDGNGIEDKEFKERIDKAPSYSSFYFGNKYEFNTVSELEEKKEYILYYIDIQ